MASPASLPYELVFLTTSNSVVVKDSDQACYRLHGKSTDATAAASDPILRDARKQLQNSKRLPWRPSGRLKEQLRELDAIQEKESCLATSWIAPKLLAMLFGNGVLYVLHIENCSISKVFVDRSLCDRLTESRSERPVHAVLHGKTIAIAFYEPKVVVVRLPRSLAAFASGSGHRWRPLASEAKITSLATVGVGGRRADRRLTWAPSRGWLVAFWNGAARDDAQPWTPLVTEKQRSNVLVYTVHQESNAIELYSYGRVERVIHAAELSQHVANNLVTVEGPPVAEEGPPTDSELDEDPRERQDPPPPIYAAYICVYQIGQGRFVRLSCVTVSLDSPLTGCGFHQPLQRLLLSTTAQTIICYDAVRRRTSSRTLAVIVHRISWHPGGSFALLSSLQGKLLVVDLALNILPLCAMSDRAAPHDLLDLNPFFRHKPTPIHIEWEPKPATTVAPPGDSSSLGVLLIDRTCLVLFNVQLCNRPSMAGSDHLEAGWAAAWGPAQLCELYNRHGAIDSALSLLRALSWAEYGPTCYRMLIKCCNQLLMQRLDERVEAQLEAAMASFFCESSFLDEGIFNQFMPKVVNLARRFFFELMRHGRYEKAFQLAVDIESVDLFYDLCTVAERLRLSGLVRASQRKIEELESSTCSSSFSSRGTTSTSDPSEPSGSDSVSSSEDELQWGEHQFIQLEPTKVKVAAATPTKQLTLVGPTAGAGVLAVVGARSIEAVGSPPVPAVSPRGVQLPSAVAPSAVAIDQEIGLPPVLPPGLSRPQHSSLPRHPARPVPVSRTTLDPTRSRTASVGSRPLPVDRSRPPLPTLAVPPTEHLPQPGTRPVPGSSSSLGRPVRKRTAPEERRVPSTELRGGSASSAEQTRQLAKGVESVYPGKL